MNKKYSSLEQVGEQNKKELFRTVQSLHNKIKEQMEDTQYQRNYYTMQIKQF